MTSMTADVVKSKQKSSECMNRNVLDGFPVSSLGGSFMPLATLYLVNSEAQNIYVTIVNINLGSGSDLTMHNNNATCWIYSKLFG